MNPEFKRCLEKKKIVRFTAKKSLVVKEIKTAREDLENAKFGLKHGKYKWSTIQGYYAMFHSARALLLSQGYREKSHYCLLVSLKELFVESGQLEIEHYEHFYSAMLLREDAEFSLKRTAGSW